MSFLNKLFGNSTTSTISSNGTSVCCINGVTYVNGKRIDETNPKPAIRVDGKEVDDKTLAAKKATLFLFDKENGKRLFHVDNVHVEDIVIVGSVGNLESTAGNIILFGHAKSASSTSGNVTVVGDVYENASSVSGDVKANVVHGNTQTVSGDIRKSRGPTPQNVAEFDSAIKSSKDKVVSLIQAVHKAEVSVDASTKVDAERSVQYQITDQPNVKASK